VKESLKSIHVWQSYARNKKGTVFFDSQCSLIFSFHEPVFYVKYENIIKQIYIVPSNKVFKKWKSSHKQCTETITEVFKS